MSVSGVTNSFRHSMGPIRNGQWEEKTWRKEKINESTEQWPVPSKIGENKAEKGGLGLNKNLASFPPLSSCLQVSLADLSPEIFQDLYQIKLLSP